MTVAEITDTGFASIFGNSRGVPSLTQSQYKALGLNEFHMQVLDGLQDSETGLTLPSLSRS